MITIDAAVYSPMIFLIEYDRSAGKLLQLIPFADDARAAAQDQRLKLELDLNHRNIEREVVFLEAPSKEALLVTHRRYFRNAADIQYAAEVAESLDKL